MGGVTNDIGRKDEEMTPWQSWLKHGNRFVAWTVEYGRPKAVWKQHSDTKDTRYTLERFVVTLCDACLNGANGVCHVPECVFYRMKTPDLECGGTWGEHLEPFKDDHDGSRA